VSYRFVLGRSALGVFVAGLFANLAMAQGKEPLSQPAMVPIDLVAALTASAGVPGADVPRILVGSVPEWFAPKIVVPKGAKILGSAFQGTVVLAIVSIPTVSDSIVGELRGPLIERGWKIPPVIQPPAYGGFRPAPVPVSVLPTTRLTVCDGDRQMTVNVVHQDSQRADIAYRIFTTSGVGGVCNPYPQPPRGMVQIQQPTLYNPPTSADARMTGDCSTMNGGASTSNNTVLRTAMGLDAVLDHYSKQLVDSGWKSDSERGTIAGRSFTRTDSLGNPLVLSLTVSNTARTEMCRDVTMQIRMFRRP
jgi:hypothetical protein